MLCTDRPSHEGWPQAEQASRVFWWREKGISHTYFRIRWIICGVGGCLLTGEQVMAKGLGLNTSLLGSNNTAVLPYSQWHRYWWATSWVQELQPQQYPAHWGLEQRDRRSQTKAATGKCFLFLLKSMFQGKICRFSILQPVLLRQRQTWHGHSIFLAICSIRSRVVFPAGEGGLAGMERYSLKITLAVSLCWKQFDFYHLQFDF